MKINPLVSFAFNRIRTNQEAGFSWSRKDQDIALADALQQAVAENLHREFYYSLHTNTQEGIPCFLDGKICVDPRHDFITWDHWLAEAGKLLRGEK